MHRAFDQKPQVFLDQYALLNWASEPSARASLSTLCHQGHTRISSPWSSLLVPVGHLWCTHQSIHAYRGWWYSCSIFVVHLIKVGAKSTDPHHSFGGFGIHWFRRWGLRMLSLRTPIRWWLLEGTLKPAFWTDSACNRHQAWWPARVVRVSGGVGGVQPEACQGVICTCWLLTMSGEKIIRELQWENEQIKLLICSNWYNQMGEKSLLANYQVTKKNVCFIVKWYMS